VIARTAALLVGSSLLRGCEGIQSALAPQGPQAARIATLWWVMLGICGVVLVIVCVLVVAAVLRGRRQNEEIALSREHQWWLVLAGGVVVPTVVLIGLVIYSTAISRAMVSAPADSLRVQVTGRQWWWAVNYPGEGRTDLNVTTANELHIPVGRPVSIELQSRDVIHSFWVPNLHGKTDIIPGRTTHTWLQADRAGSWRGQCAEYCGLQHAHMAFIVVAHPPEEFDRWMEAQREPAPEARDPIAVRGRDVFLGGTCAMCHTVRGTLALGSVGPDLTHVASRRTLASGTLPNTAGHLAGWIVGPQAIKPGTRMPPASLDPEDLHALLAYLDMLK
jgi:cytochrome c oxidase subunit II